MTTVTGLHGSDDGMSGDTSKPLGVWRGLRTLGVEARGIVPTEDDERTDPHFWNVFFIWLSANCNILS